MVAVRIVGVLLSTVAPAKAAATWVAPAQATSGSFIDTEIATFNSSLAVDATSAEHMAVDRWNPDFGSQRTT